MKKLIRCSSDLNQFIVSRDNIKEIESDLRNVIIKLDRLEDVTNQLYGEGAASRIADSINQIESAMNMIKSTLKRKYASSDTNTCNIGMKADIKESSKNESLKESARFSPVTGSADYYDYSKYSKTLYLPSIRQGKVKLTIGTFSDPRYDDDNTFEILAVVDVESRRDDFTLDSEKLYKKLNINDGHEKLSGYDDRYDNIEDTVDEIYEYFMTLDQDDIDETLIELADDADVNRVNRMFGPVTTL